MAKTPAERKEYLRLYHLANKDKAKAHMKAWHEAHPGYAVKRRIERKEADPGAVKAADRARHYAFRDANLARMKIRSGNRTRQQRDEENAKAREVYAEDLDKQRLRSAAYYNANREQVLEKCGKYYRANTAQARAKCSERWGRVKLATPSWADMDKMNSMYDLARSVTALTGVPHEVDHAIPIIHKLVCGLHCEANMQVLTAEANRRKSNKFEIEGED